MGDAKYSNKDEVEPFPEINEMQFGPVCDTSSTDVTPWQKAILVPEIRPNQVWSTVSILDLFNNCDLAFTLVQSSLHTFLSVMPCKCSIYCCNQLHGSNVCFPSLARFCSYVFDPRTPKVALILWTSINSGHVYHKFYQNGIIILSLDNSSVSECQYYFSLLDSIHLVYGHGLGIAKQFSFPRSYQVSKALLIWCLIYFSIDFVGLFFALSDVYLDFLRIPWMIIMTFDPGQVKKGCQLHVWFEDSIMAKVSLLLIINLSHSGFPLIFHYVEANPLYCVDVFWDCVVLPHALPILLVSFWSWFMQLAPINLPINQQNALSCESGKLQLYSLNTYHDFNQIFLKVWNNFKSHEKVSEISFDVVERKLMDEFVREFMSRKTLLLLAIEPKYQSCAFDILTRLLKDGTIVTTRNSSYTMFKHQVHMIPTSFKIIVMSFIIVQEGVLTYINTRPVWHSYPFNSWIDLGLHLFGLCSLTSQGLRTLQTSREYLVAQHCFDLEDKVNFHGVDNVTDAIIINGPDGMIIGLGSKGLSWKELLSYIYM